MCSRGIFRTISSIYEGAFFEIEERLNVVNNDFRQKAPDLVISGCTSLIRMYKFDTSTELFRVYKYEV